VIAARRRDNTGGRRAPRQQAGESAARLERAGVLQEFELQDKRLAGDAEIAGIDPDNRRTPDVGADQPLGRGDPRPVNNRAADRGLRRAVAQNCTLPSDGGAVRTGGGRCCTAGRVTLGGGNG
jgi:hypothetical protein